MEDADTLAKQVYSALRQKLFLARGRASKPSNQRRAAK